MEITVHCVHDNHDNHEQNFSTCDLIYILTGWITLSCLLHLWLLVLVTVSWCGLTHCTLYDETVKKNRARDELVRSLPLPVPFIVVRGPFTLSAYVDDINVFVARQGEVRCF